MSSSCDCIYNISFYLHFLADPFFSSVELDTEVALKNTATGSKVKLHTKNSTTIHVT